MHPGCQNHSGNHRCKECNKLYHRDRYNRLEAATVLEKPFISPMHLQKAEITEDGVVIWKS